jgi:tRNA A37 threonylcarbamoyladenosine dehydratase
MKITFTNKDEILNLLNAMTMTIVNTNTQIENLQYVADAKTNIKDKNSLLKFIEKRKIKQINDNKIRAKLEKVYMGY